VYWLCLAYNFIPWYRDVVIQYALHIQQLICWLWRVL